MLAYNFVYNQIVHIGKYRCNAMQIWLASIREFDKIRRRTSLTSTASSCNRDRLKFRRSWFLLREQSFSYSNVVFD